MSDQEDIVRATSPQSERLSRIGRPAPRRSAPTRRYSVFIRWMRVVLPMSALGIVAVLLSWNSVRRDTIVPSAEPSAEARAIGKNELLAPRFESLDDKGQPYTITARRAVQGEGEDGLVLLDDPMADMVLSGGDWVAVRSDQAAFAQQDQRLLLKDHVTLYHDQGYMMQMSELDVDLKTSVAWTDVSVRGHGPAGTIDAQGLRAESPAGILIFKGPARLVLFDTGSGNHFNLEGQKP
ncbi:MAG: LPS export ABC transporter periplasmic protein LptC [Alphaproteobacteria bacterium]|nr:LPS export ABC transporter periplasmic protein LptC [Alphaproteobacteria bacterium]